MAMTPIGLSYRFKITFGQTTAVTGKRVRLRFSGGCAGAIGFAVGVATVCRITSAPMRVTVAKAVARRRRDCGASSVSLANKIESRDFMKLKPFKNSLAAFSLILLPAMSAAQEMRPLNELLDTVAAPYPATRCAGWYQSLMEWGGKERLGEEAWGAMDAGRQSLMVLAAVQFNQTSGNTFEADLEFVLRDVRNIGDLYLARMERNYASQGEAFAQDEMITSDMLICQRLAETAVAFVSE